MRGAQQVNTRIRFMAKVAIVYHSGFGHTKVQAEAVHRGACRVKNVEAVLIPIEEYETHWEALDRADAIVMGAPTYMAGASAQFKAFLDATSSRWAEQRWKDKRSPPALPTRLGITGTSSTPCSSSISLRCSTG